MISLQKRWPFLICVCALFSCTHYGQEIPSEDDLGAKGDHAGQRDHYEPIDWCSVVEGNLNNENRWDGYAFHIGEDEACENVAVNGSHWEIYFVDENNPESLRAENRVASSQSHGCEDGACEIGTLAEGDYVLVVTTETHLEHRTTDVPRPTVTYGAMLQCLTTQTQICYDPRNHTCNYDERIDLQYSTSNPDHVSCINLSVPSEDDRVNFADQCGCGERCFPSATQPGVTYTNYDCAADTVVDTLNPTSTVYKSNSCGCTIVDVQDYCQRAMDAQIDPVGTCLVSKDFGWKWNQGTCEHVVGCECEGEDCGELFPTEEACRADGETYCSTMNGCRVMDATPVNRGACAPLNRRRYKFTERGTCEIIGGCGCRGEDCDNLFESREACENTCIVN